MTPDEPAYDEINDYLVDEYMEYQTKCWCESNGIDYESYKTELEKKYSQPTITLEELPW